MLHCARLSKGSEVTWLWCVPGSDDFYQISDFPVKLNFETIRVSIAQFKAINVVNEETKTIEITVLNTPKIEEIILTPSGYINLNSKESFF